MTRIQPTTSWTQRTQPSTSWAQGWDGPFTWDTGYITFDTTQYTFDMTMLIRTGLITTWDQNRKIALIELETWLDLQLESGELIEAEWGTKSNKINTLWT